MNDVTVLVTGASGYVGGRMARRYLDNGATVLAHGRRPIELDGAHPVVGDLRDPDPFAGLDPEWRDRITHVFHAAAVTRFDVDRETARSVNVDGTAKLVELARRCPRLESFGLVSTVYATGLRAGLVAEQLYDDEPGFANEYEWSKWRAEQLVAQADESLPWRILRVGTVVADDGGGKVTQHNAFHDTLKLWFHGLLPLVPGSADTPLYLVTGDFVTAAAIALMQHDGAGGDVFHVTSDAPNSLTLAQVLDVVSDAFESVEAFRRRRVLRPLLGDRESFDLLVGGVSNFAGGMVRQSLQSVVPFARQLFVRKELDATRARDVLGDGFQLPDPAQLVRRTCEWLVTSRWGRADAVA